MDYRIFKVRTDVTDTVTQSALKVLGEKSLAAERNRPGASGVPVQCPYELSYIPSHSLWAQCNIGRQE